MLKELENNFSLLEKKIFEMNKSYQNLLEKHAILSEDFENLKVKYEEEHKRNQELTEEQKKNKINLSNIWQSRPQSIDEKSY